MTFTYLGLANLLLQTRLLRDLASKGPDLELEYESAYSLWPGRAHFRGLTLEAQDYSVQFAIRVESGEIDVSLHELFVKRFRALRLQIQGTSFRLRHKVHGVGDNAERLVAYPPIRGYPDPPLYEGPKPPPVSDAEYDLWEIALEGIDAELSEVWILEHRYLGRGLARGGFHLRPSRWFEVYPATVKLDRGALLLGKKTFASPVSLDVGARIERTDVTKESSLGVLRSITAKVSLDIGDVDSSVADVYLPQDLHAAGWLRVVGGASMTSGVLDPGSEIELTVCPLRLATRSRALEGNLTSRFRVVEPGKVAAKLESSVFAFGRDGPGQSAATLIAPRLEADFSIGDVTQPFRLERAEASLPELKVPSLGLVAELVSRTGSPLEVAGRLDADAHLVWRPQAGLEGRVKARVVGGLVDIGELRATFGALAEVELARVRDTPGTSRGPVALELDNVQLREQGRQSAPFRAAARTQALRLSLVPEPRVSATWQITADPADALLSVLVGAPLLEDLAAAVLDLKRLSAKTKLTASRRQTRLELLRGESGALAGSGYWQRPASHKASGAFLLTTNVANLGLAIDGPEVETDMFVADDWLEKRRAAEPKQGAETR